MTKITEAELTDFVRNRAIKRFSIVQGESGKYQVVIALNWKEGDCQLVTFRKKPREWASLDRLARHIAEKYGGELPRITLTLSKSFFDGELAK